MLLIGVLGSAVAMDKGIAKQIMSASGIAQQKFITLRDTDDQEKNIDQAISQLGLPVFVKPANMGSSIGVKKAKTRAEIVSALTNAFEFDEWALIEEAVIGREIEVAVLFFNSISFFNFSKDTKYSPSFIVIIISANSSEIISAFSAVTFKLANISSSSLLNGHLPSLALYQRQIYRVARLRSRSIGFHLNSHLATTRQTFLLEPAQSFQRYLQSMLRESLGH